MTNLVIFARLLISGELFAKVISGIIFCIGLFLFIYSIFIKTIALSILTDSEFVYDPQYALKWWNFYKHPLTAMAKSNFGMISTEECRL